MTFPSATRKMRPSKRNRTIELIWISSWRHVIPTDLFVVGLSERSVLARYSTTNNIKSKTTSKFSKATLVNYPFSILTTAFLSFFPDFAMNGLSLH